MDTTTARTTFTDEPRDAADGLTYTMCTILTVTAIAAVFGNFMVIAVILRSSKLHTITWALLFNLAVSDFLLASLLVPMVIGMQASRDGAPGMGLCGLVGFLYTVLAEASIWTLTLLSIERYFAVNQPLHYHQRVTKRRVAVAVCTLWICAVCWGVVPFAVSPGYGFNRRYRMCLPRLGVAAHLAFRGIGICLPFVILCCMYVSIGRIAFTQAQRKVIECDEDNCRYVSPKHKDYRAVKILALLAGVFATCWLPFNAISILDHFVGEPVHSSLCQLSLAATLVNAAINPWIYSILNRAFRTAAGKQLRAVRGGVRCRCVDNKVCPPSCDGGIELERGDFGKGPVAGGDCRRSREADSDRRWVPLLPNQVSEPQVTMSSNSSQLQKPVLPSMTRNKTF